MLRFHHCLRTVFSVITEQDLSPRYYMRSVWVSVLLYIYE